MNPTQHSQSSTLERPHDNDEIDLLDLLDTILEGKWLIAAITIVFTFFALAYALLSTPIYQANTMIHVEQNQPTPPAVGELALLFDMGSPVAAEIEILRSRMVVGETVDRLQLNNFAQPDYLPIIGAWLAKRATSLSNPGFLGFGGYVSGTESIRLKQLVVPAALTGQELKLIATDHGYDLFTSDNELLLKDGVPGQAFEFQYQGETAQIHIAELQAKPGASFTLRSNSRLTSIADLQKQLSVSEKGNQSGMLAVTLNGANPSEISQILNTLGQVFVKQNVDRKAAEADKSLNFLDSFLPQLREQMQMAESEYTQFRDEQGTFDLGAEGMVSLDTSVNLQLKLLELEQKRRQLTPQFTAAHPSIKAIDQQISALKTEIEGLEANVRKMPALEQELLALTRNVKVNSEMYVNLLNSAQQLRLVKEGKVGNVRVIDEAVAPLKPIKPKKKLILALGILMGIMAGTMLVLLRSFLRPGIQEPHEIEQSLGMHVFATIPRSLEQSKQFKLTSDKAPGTHVLAHVAPSDPAIESLRSLRTSLQFAMLEATNNIVLITGPTPNIGKSFISVNFASVIGAADKKILLIDSDLRKGYLNQYFGKPRHNGFSEFISGNIDANQAIHQEVLPNVDFMATGVLPPNPAELLLSSVTIEKIKRLAEHYDLVLIDSTPILAVSDALALAPYAGTTFLLARAGETTLGELDESIKRIRQAGGHVKGIIFNDMVAKSRRYGSKYGYYRYTNYEYEAKS